ncbi:hypothetical protein V6Z12_D05G368000 [Gossypium hirsutum]
MICLLCYVICCFYHPKWPKLQHKKSDGHSQKRCSMDSDPEPHRGHIELLVSRLSSILTRVARKFHEIF